MSSSAPAHGLFVDAAPPSLSVLEAWLDEHDVKRSRGLAVELTEDAGWRVTAQRDYELGEHLCQVPKTAILSMRTTSMPSLLPEANLKVHSSHTILYLALALLHEIRLGEQSSFWGYIQILPRETIVLPIFWHVKELAGEDGAKAMQWLSGTEAERDMNRRDAEDLSLNDVNNFYTALAPHLPLTQSHSEPSSLLAYYHAYSLICTRAFLIDLYHTVALCPFADLFNHSSSNGHTSLSSDDFVCHVCGSLKACKHDIPSTSGVVKRLEHLPDDELRRVSTVVDTVDLRVDESRPHQGLEVYNQYGEDMGDARLLVEWGFVEEDGVCGDIHFNADDLQCKPGWESVLEEVLADSEWLDQLDEEDNQGRAHMISPDRRINFLHIDADGRISLSLYVLANINSCPVEWPLDELRKQLRASIAEIEAAWVEEEAEYGLTQLCQMAARGVRQAIEKKKARMHLPDLSVDELYELRDALGGGKPLQHMAMTVAINERSLLDMVHRKWMYLDTHHDSETKPLRPTPPEKLYT